jgi:hypothetical protein
MVAVKNDLLERPMDNMERALAEDGEAPAEWARTFDSASADLVRAMREHVKGAEAPNGALTTLESSKQQTLATLDRHVHDLRLEHAQLIDGVGELHGKAQGLLHRLGGSRQARSAAVGAEIALLRQAGEELLNRLREHREAEQKLLMDTINTDVGVGD